MSITSFYHQTKHFLWAVALCAGLTYSACDNFTEGSFGAADIRHFSFDSFPDFADYAFYIDNFKNVIYNEDSLPYLSKVDSIYPNITVVSTNNEIYFNDTLWKLEQIVDFSRSPLTLTNTSENGKYTKSYKVFVNIHQVDPDSMVMKVVSNNYPKVSKKQKLIADDQGYTAVFQLNDGTLSLASSSDGVSWTSSDRPQTGWLGNAHVESLSSFNRHYYLTTQQGKMLVSDNLSDWALAPDTTPVKALFGTLSGRKYLSDDALIGIVTDSLGQYRFAKYDSCWTMGELVPEDFPIESYAITYGKTVTDVPFCLISTGINAQGDYSQHNYSTMNGLYWATIEKQSDVIGKRKGASLFYYNDRLFLYGGVNPSGQLDPALYVSENHGITWSKAVSKWQFKDIETGLSYQQILADEKYIRIFGGNSYDETLSVWKGYINKMIF